MTEGDSVIVAQMFLPIGIRGVLGGLQAPSVSVSRRIQLQMPRGVSFSYLLQVQCRFLWTFISDLLDRWQSLNLLPGLFQALRA